MENERINYIKKLNKNKDKPKTQTLEPIKKEKPISVAY